MCRDALNVIRVVCVRDAPTDSSSLRTTELSPALPAQPAVPPAIPAATVSPAHPATRQSLSHLSPVSTSVLQDPTSTLPQAPVWQPVPPARLPVLQPPTAPVVQLARSCKASAVLLRVPSASTSTPPPRPASLATARAWDASTEPAAAATHVPSTLLSRQAPA